MSTEGVNQGRRLFLVGATSVVGAAGAVGAAVPFVQSWWPSAKAKSAGAPVVADISKLELGQRMTVEWRGRPVWIMRRTPEALATLKEVEGRLRDPASLEKDQQPEYAANPTRSRQEHPEIAVLVGICTHLGCSPLYRPEVAPADLGAEWKGGFFCPCHGSKFDMAGRVFQGVPAPLNLEVPSYYFMSENLIKIGEDGGAA
jgi:ubiquinol-cytochrome c reductase iron-sulfur subunit